MKTLALVLLLGASATWAETTPTSLVWLPPENFDRWSELTSYLRARDGVKMTIGLTPSLASPLAMAELKPWLDRGRVEIAARIDGDPILTMATAHPDAPRPQDALERVSEARELLRKRLGFAPAGCLPGAGALNADIAAALGASGCEWILTGPNAPAGGPWIAAGRATLVPSAAAQIYDESISTASTFLLAAKDLPRPIYGWATVGELVRPQAPGTSKFSAASTWSAWNEEVSRVPPVDPGMRSAWTAYGAAAKAVERYQNSGSADLATLDAAVERLRKAQSSRYYRASPSAGISSEFRAALLAVYRQLKIPAPDSLYDAASENASTPSDRPTAVRAISGPSSIEFRAPLGAIALAPSLSSGAKAGISDGGPAADPWRIRSLRVEWRDSAVRLVLHVGRVSDVSPRPVYEIYTDFNHVLGAGRVPLLDGRGALVPARDAWELALSIAGEEAILFRTRGGGEPEETASFKTEWDAARGEVAVNVPRSFMRGNPARWGWSVVALAEDPARPGRRPAASLVGPDGTIILGALVPEDFQKQFLSRANPRVPAARLDP